MKVYPFEGSPMIRYRWTRDGVEYEVESEATFEAVATGHFKEYGSTVEVLLVALDREGPGDPVPVLGFSNQPTCNAALTIETTGALRKATEGVGTPERLRALAAPAIGREGGSCYGVDWREVLDHLRGLDAMSAADDAGRPPRSALKRPGTACEPACLGLAVHLPDSVRPAARRWRRDSTAASSDHGTILLSSR